MKTAYTYRQYGRRAADVYYYCDACGGINMAFEISFKLNMAKMQTRILKVVRLPGMYLLCRSSACCL